MKNGLEDEPQGDFSALERKTRRRSEEALPRREVQIEIAGETILQHMLISFRNCGRFEIETLGTFAQKQGDNRSGLVAQVPCARSNLQTNLPKQLQFPRKAGD